MLKNHQGPISQFVLPKSFIHKVILACHDDNGHLGMVMTLGLLQERFFWPKMADYMHTHIHTCNRCLRFKQPREKSEMYPILVSYPMELVHLDFLTLGGKADDNRNDKILIVTDHFHEVCTSIYNIKTNKAVPTHAKRNWQEWVTTLTHAYNYNVSPVTGFSPYFLMFGLTPKIPLDIEMGVTLMEPGDMSSQNYVKKLKARLKWAY